MSIETRNSLFSTLKTLQNEPAGSFCYDNMYCELMNCEADDCEEHFGSVLEAIPDAGGNIIVVVGTGGPHFELKTREYALFGYWSNEEVRISYDREKCETVRDFWHEIHSR